MAPPPRSPRQGHQKQAGSSRFQQVVQTQAGRKAREAHMPPMREQLDPGQNQVVVGVRLFFPRGLRGRTDSPEAPRPLSLTTQCTAYRALSSPPVPESSKDL